MAEDVFQMYLREISEIESCDQAENQQLFELLRAGNSAAKDRIIEGNLKMVLEMVQEFLNRGVSAGDLVQEANMALVLAVADYKEGIFEDYLREQVREALLMAVERQSKEEGVAWEMVDRVNRLKDISKEMAEELGREATVEELAQHMGMTNEEIREIMKVTMDAMSLGRSEYALFDR